MSACFAGFFFFISVFISMKNTLCRNDGSKDSRISSSALKSENEDVNLILVFGGAFSLV